MHVIHRYPKLKKDPLQAWDSADELLLAHVKTLKPAPQKILILNDSFGALSTGLKDREITAYTDSYVSAQGILLNSGGAVKPVNTLSQMAGEYDLVLIKLPNNLSFFEDTLAHLSQFLKSGTPVIAAGMVKYMVESYFELIQKYVGPTTTSLAKKKARLIFSKFEKTASPSPYPITVAMKTFDRPFIQTSNLFSREKLDIGTRFFLDQVPQGVTGTILDLGCANGIIGIRAKQLNPKAKVIFTDDSMLAIESAKINYERLLGPAGADVQFIWTNCFEHQPSESVDLVLCNPPFHQATTVGDFIALQMFADSRSALKKGGKLRVIGNSQLGYEAKLKKIFGVSTLVATHPKFVIIDAQVQA